MTDHPHTGLGHVGPVTAVEQVAAVLRECGAVNAWLDDSAQDGGWQVDSSEGWYLSTAEAVLEALADRQEGREPGCPRCGVNRPLARFAVCAQCAAEMGWEPHCPACHLGQAGKDVGDTLHVDTCGGPS